MEEGDDEGRKRKPESSMEVLLIQAETARWGGASPVGGTRKLQIILQRNSVLNSYQQKLIQSQGTRNSAWRKNRARPSPERGFVRRDMDLGV